MKTTTRRLTVRGINALKPRASRYQVADAYVPGLGLRVTPRGHKSWVLVYRYRGRQRRLTLGRYPDRGLAAARKEAIRQRGRVLDGADPAAEKRERVGNDHTVAALYDCFRARFRGLKSWTELRRIFEHDVLPCWRERLVSGITRGDIRALVDRKARVAPVMANRILARISRLLSFAVELDWIPVNPAVGIRPPTREIGRDRVLSRTELAELWGTLHNAHTTGDADRSCLSETLTDAFVVLLLTAQRGGEVWRMRWADIDRETGWWTIPAAASKNGTAHRVPLTAPALEILDRRAQDADVEYVFSNGHRTCVADRAKKAASQLCRGLSFQFRAHDLRRTAASYMAEAGVDRMHIAHVLNHRSVTHGGVTAVYDRYTYDREKRRALECWASVLDAVRATHIVGYDSAILPNGTSTIRIGAGHAGPASVVSSLQNVLRAIRDSQAQDVFDFVEPALEARTTDTMRRVLELLRTHGQESEIVIRCRQFVAVLVLPGK